MSRAIMCHVVAGYPDTEGCLQLLQGMQAAGVTALEIQIPFSDPIADGSTIMQANDVALEHSMTTAVSFELIEKARAQGVDCDLFVMSYLQKIRHFGLAEFCERAAASHIKGLIVPDLPYDSPEFSQLQQLSQQHQLDIVPVLSPGMSTDRLQAIMQLAPPVVYVTSSQGITGNDYAPAEELRKLVQTIKSSSSATVMIGFGISSPQDVDDVLAIGDVAVVGSAVIKKLQTTNVEETLTYVQSLVMGN